jgi:hypothetical protein
MAIAVLAIEPPQLDDSFHVNFDETFIQNGSSFKINGQWFYDFKNNRERTDRINGKYDIFCGTVLPNVSTYCQLYTVNSKRYIVFPQKNQCCFCCDSSHGCGILKKDWLSGAKYLNTERIVDTTYDKWSKDGIHCYKNRRFRIQLLVGFD